jgi:hypothetical protein
MNHARAEAAKNIKSAAANSMASNSEKLNGEADPKKVGPQHVEQVIQVGPPTLLPSPFLFKFF